MPYQGRQPGVGVRNRFIFIATSGQTSFSGADSNGLTLKYPDATYTDVFLNGVLLIPVTDYAATNNTSVVLSSGAGTSDVVEIVAYDISSIANTVPVSGGTFTGPVTVGGTLDVTGTTTVDALTATGATSLSTLNTTGNVDVGGTLDVPYDGLRVNGVDQGMLHIGATHKNISGSSSTTSASYVDYSQSSLDYQKKKASSYLRIRCWLDVGGSFGTTTGQAYMGTYARLLITDLSNSSNTVGSVMSQAWIRVDTHTGTLEWTRMIFLEWTPDQNTTTPAWITNGTPNINIKVQYYRTGTGNMGISGCGIWGGRSIITVDEFDRRT